MYVKWNLIKLKHPMKIIRFLKLKRYKNGDKQAASFKIRSCCNVFSYGSSWTKGKTRTRSKKIINSIIILNKTHLGASSYTEGASIRQRFRLAGRKQEAITNLEQVKKFVIYNGQRCWKWVWYDKIQQVFKSQIRK